MTVTLPPWEAWAIAALGVLGASTIASLAMAGAITILKRRAGGRPAPGAGAAPVPGSAAPPARPPRDPARQANPAPGPRHRTGGLSYAVRVWNCGCIHLYDGRGALTGCTPCIPASLEDEIKDLLS